MKLLLTSACLLGYFSLSTPVVAGTSADFLLHLCDSDDESSRFACSAYISGATEMFAVYQILALKGSLLPTLGLEYPRESVMASDETWTHDRKMEAR